jgi:hypothetical protein
MARGWLVIWVGAALTIGGGMARAENLDAGKPAPALFAATCSACHASARGLAKNTSGLVSYLREHYTASPESASILAAYLIANAGDPRAKQAPASARAAVPAEGAPAAKRRPGQTPEPAAKSEPPARPQTATARPDSMIEPVEPRRHHDESAKGAKGGKRQPLKQETTAAPPTGAAEPAASPPAASPPASSPPPAAPVAAAPPPDQPAFSAPSP